MESRLKALRKFTDRFQRTNSGVWKPRGSLASPWQPRAALRNSFAVSERDISNQYKLEHSAHFRTFRAITRSASVEGRSWFTNAQNVERKVGIGSRTRKTSTGRPIIIQDRAKRRPEGRYSFKNEQNVDRKAGIGSRSSKTSTEGRYSFKNEQNVDRKAHIRSRTSKTSAGRPVFVQDRAKCRPEGRYSFKNEQNVDRKAGIRSRPSKTSTGRQVFIQERAKRRPEGRKATSECCHRLCEAPIF